MAHALADSIKTPVWVHVCDTWKVVNVPTPQNLSSHFADQISASMTLKPKWPYSRLGLSRPAKSVSSPGTLITTELVGFQTLKPPRICTMEKSYARKTESRLTSARNPIARAWTWMIAETGHSIGAGSVGSPPSDSPAHPARSDGAFSLSGSQYAVARSLFAPICLMYGRMKFSDAHVPFRIIRLPINSWPWTIIVTGTSFCFDLRDSDQIVSWKTQLPTPMTQ